MRHLQSQISLFTTFFSLLYYQSMGWSKKRKGRIARNGEGATDEKKGKKQDASHRSYDEIPKENDKLINYYKVRLIICSSPISYLCRD